MQIVKKMKQFFLNQSDMYRFYEKEYHKNKSINKEVKNNTKQLKKLEKDFINYKNYNENIINSYHRLLNNLFIYNKVEPKRLVQLSHELTMQLLDFVNNVCEKHDLQWWMFAGTLLGAFRHEGFIPWDDDCDINMIREDYESFFKIFPLEIEKYNLSDCIEINATTMTPTGYYLPFLKVNYWFDQEADELLTFLDIFPVDYLEDEIPDYVSKHKNEHQVIIKKLLDGQDRDTVINESSKKLHITQNKTNLLTNGVEDPGFETINKYDDIFPLTSLKFENRVYPCPNKPDLYIEKLYGKNFRQIPKISRDHGHYEYISKQEDIYTKLEDAIAKLQKVNDDFK